MITKDDRTPEQRTTHTTAVVMRDDFLSGWGEASGGYSRCAWAVDSAAHHSVLTAIHFWVRSREEAKHVKVVNLRTYRPPRGTKHFHIYVLGPEHPALKGDWNS